MSDVIISVEGLGKKYVLNHQGERGGYARFSEKLESWIKKPFAALAGGGRREVEGNLPPTSFHLPQASKEEFWALKDVSFEVKRGEVVGIIGRNGAGKSTLLKILSRITEPTEGRVTLRGRVASLLEVGTGFHPELTGRENIFLNGAILGMSKAEIRKRFDEIVAFAEVERFLDTPVKRYSSGMYVRLAFAVAAHLEPDILVVDEVLAVGDVNFQRKCIGKMKSVATQGGRTVLFVSHNSGALRALCAKGVVLKRGNLIAQGEINKIVSEYEKENLLESQSSTALPCEVFPGLKLTECRFQPSAVSSDDKVIFNLALEASKKVQITGVCLLFYSASGVRVGVADLRRPEGGYEVSLRSPLKLSGFITKLNLVEATYYVGIHLNSAEFSGDLLNLTSIDVVPRKEARSVPPYPAHYRGFAEFDYEVRVISPNVNS